MPQLSPLSLSLPTTSPLDFSTFKNIYGPSHFLNCLQQENWTSIKQKMEALTLTKKYNTHPAQYYWYRYTHRAAVFEGILTGVKLSKHARAISTHERILPERVKLFSAYLTKIKRQAEPLLLAHESPDFTNQLKKSICAVKHDFDFHNNMERHQLWIIPPKAATTLENFAKNCAQFHLADGHHRLASIQDWAIKNQHNATVFAFLLAKDQLRNSRFLWALKTTALPKIVTDKMMTFTPDSPLWVQTKQGKFSLPVAENINVAHYLYYDLLGNCNGAVNTKLDYLPPGEQSKDYLDQFTAVFGFNALTIEEVISIAKQEQQLPPKSTYITPKLPTGLFIAPLEDH